MMIAVKVKEAEDLEVRIINKRLALFLCSKINRFRLTFISFLPIIKSGDYNEN